jgi:serine/threonine protein phosphatase 1
MAQRTFAIGDIHGDMDHLERVLAKLPAVDRDDTLVLLGDYIDRGPRSRDVIDYIRGDLPRRFAGKVVVLRGNHEDGWLRVASGGWPEFVIPRSNGCFATLRSYEGKPMTEEMPNVADWEAMSKAAFFPEGTIDWFNSLHYFYEDEHAIYVHAGLVEKDGGFLHPRDTDNPALLLWLRTKSFFEGYTGKRVVCGHTSTDSLPPELSSFTPDDPLDMWVNPQKTVYAIDTGCGKGGFLTALELPALVVYESR